MRAKKLGWIAGIGVAGLYVVRALRRSGRKKTLPGKQAVLPRAPGLHPHGTINRTEFTRQYKANGPFWDKAFYFLRTHDLSLLAAGDYPLAGDDVVVKVSFGPAKEEREVQWEAHIKFLDIQVVGAGRERMGVGTAANAVTTIPYDSAKDIAHYDLAGTYYVAEPGTYFIFFPQDVHRPGIRIDDEPVRKIVVKIRAAP